MAIPNKSDSEAQQLADRASLILKQRRNLIPLKNVAENLPVDQINATEATLKSLHMPENQIVPPPQAKPSLRQRIRMIPGLGYAMAWCNALLRLPRTRLQTEQALTNLQKQIDGLQHQLHMQNDRIAQFEIHKLITRMDQYDALDIGNRLMQFDRMQIARQLKSVNLMLRTSLQNEKTAGEPGKLVVAGTNDANDVPVIEARVKVQPAALTGDFDQDQFYLEFEALFRGSREDIKQRLQVYLPYLSHITAQSKDQRKMVIDVGCGRGEWLELLDENDIPAMGVDMNASMVNACLEKGFLVRHADAIAYLREQPQGSVGAVTGFQIIEHLPFEQLIALFDAARHALCPGGVIIFETPNPENLKVGACNFYFDPTHLHPIVPQVAEFMARQRGFSHAEILRLHPYPDDHLLHGGTPVEVLINKELFGAQDYAVIGRK
ncbi:class I SAM-dependent methyltransferase [Undibacterium sp. TJN19]|uniref:class I SAM-dependent methyltransferase n=1 Tax=Undibacterium sp. TJN19 TaxID=3413055 RepID=UPI003BF1A13C